MEGESDAGNPTTDPTTQFTGNNATSTTVNPLTFTDFAGMGPATKKTRSEKKDGGNAKESSGGDGGGMMDGIASFGKLLINKLG